MDHERRQLITIAYRMLGSLAEAEDAVQEAYARWYALSPDRRAEIANPAAWLTTVTSRICLNVLGSARVRRERYVGPWVPEPVPATGDDPADRITLDESVSMAFLVVLEQMTPAERVSFILHDVLGYPFPEVAEIVGRSPAACRQLAASARRRARRAHRPAPPNHEQAAVVRDFKRAWQAGDVDALLGLLDPEAVAISDGGGRTRASRRPLHGADRIVRAYLGFLARGFTLLERTVNGRPGLVARQDGVIVTVWAFDISGDRITRIWAVRNPDKLRVWQRVS